MPTTVRDVARKARVSLGTVSRVINGEAVEAGLAKRVETALSSLNYRRLRRRKLARTQLLSGKRIALVLIGYDRSLLKLPVVAASLHGVEAAVSRGGGSLSLIDIPDPRKPGTALSDTSFDAFVCKAALQGDPLAACPRSLLSRLRSRPLVWVLGRPSGAWGDVIDTDDVEIGRLACEHLIAHGHKRLAFLNPKAGHVALDRRWMAFDWRARSVGLEPLAFIGRKEEWKLPLRAATEVSQVDALADRLLESRPRPTAVFCPADSIAALVYRALTERGLTVGRDLSIVSANNEESLQTGLHPGLDTVDVRAEEIGHCAVDRLAWRLSHAQNGNAVSIQIKPELVVRGSVRQL